MGASCDTMFRAIAVKGLQGLSRKVPQRGVFSRICNPHAAPLIRPAAQHRSIGVKTSQPAHREHRLLSFSVPQVHSVVVDVQRYDQFVPWCTESNVTSSGPGWFQADLSVGTWLFSEQFTSYVKHTEHSVSIHPSSSMFSKLDSEWGFQPGETPGTTLITFETHYELKGSANNPVAEKFITDIIPEMVKAFADRSSKCMGSLHNYLWL